jgi:hypothetical protein
MIHLPEASDSDSEDRYVEVMRPAPPDWRAAPSRGRELDLLPEMTMTEHVKALQAAREQMVQARRDLAIVLAEPYDPRKTPQSRTTLIEVQSVIDQIDKAIADEWNVAPLAPAKQLSADDPYGDGYQ